MRFVQGSLFVAVVVLLVSVSAVSVQYTIGILSLSAGHDQVIEGFESALSELAAHNPDAEIDYVFDGAVGNIDGLDAEAQRLVALPVDMVLAVSTPATLAAMHATRQTQTPVVFTVVNDPVGSGFVRSIAEPGGNLTGVRVGGSLGKLLEWLTILDPNVSTVFVPHNPGDGGSVSGVSELVPAAEQLGLKLQIDEVTTEDGLLAALETIPDDVDALLVNSSGFLQAHVSDYVAAALERMIPVVSVCTCAADGVLLTYGHNFWEDGTEAAEITHQIIHGIKPSDIAIRTADFFLGINLATADALGIYVSDALLDQADEIVR
jgi:putative tryptophan/tyrosine transport system substrate-binding protein